MSSPWWNTVQALAKTGGSGVAKDAIPTMPDLRYRYMRIEVPGYSPALLVLGYLDPHPLGPIAVWYSGSEEALRIQNGRIVGMTGSPHDWLSVKFTPAPPAWLDVPPQGFAFERQRDVSPGYRFGITERVQLTPWPGLPPVELPQTLPAKKAGEYRWFRESYTAVAGQGEATLPDAWFAWGMHRGAESILYSEQCLMPDFCIKLQRWPLLEEAR